MKTWEKINNNKKISLTHHEHNTQRKSYAMKDTNDTARHRARRPAESIEDKLGKIKSIEIKKLKKTELVILGECRSYYVKSGESAVLRILWRHRNASCWLMVSSLGS